jgi:hypothetical protein
MKIGQTVKVKSLEQLQKITKIGFQKQVIMKNGGLFGSQMQVYAGQVGIITAIVKPGKDNILVSDSYKIGEVDIYWSAELLES